LKQGDLVEAIRVLETDLPGDVEASLRRCEAEEEGNAKAVLSAILKNVRYAREKGIPMCQDTGTLVFFVSGAPDASRVYEVIEGALIRATEEVPLRPNTVSPLSRENEGRNLGRGNPIVHFERAGKADGRVEIGIMAKGAGSENVSRSCMLDPDQGADGGRRAVLDAVKAAGPKPCPPIVVGVGIGGNLEWSGYLAKRALMRRLDCESDDGQAAQLEREILCDVNALGIGPMGFGGKNTALKVNVEMGHCHTASLPITVNIQCWALRRVVAEWQGGEFRVCR